MCHSVCECLSHTYRSSQFLCHSLRPLLFACFLCFFFFTLRGNEQKQEEKKGIQSPRFHCIVQATVHFLDHTNIKSKGHPFTCVLSSPFPTPRKIIISASSRQQYTNKVKFSSRMPTHTEREGGDKYTLSSFHSQAQDRQISHFNLKQGVEGRTSRLPGMSTKCRGCMIGMHYTCIGTG